MAMTGGTAKQVKTGTPSGWPGSIKLYIYYKVDSQSVSNNTTTLLLGAYITTPSGYWLEAWADNRGSYVGTATSGTNCKTFDGTLPYKTEGTYWLVENQKVTVAHDADGSKTATIYWKWGVYSSWGGFTNPSGSFTVTLPTILRASSLICPDSGVLLEEMKLTILAANASFRHRISFQVGNNYGELLSQSDTDLYALWTPYAFLARANTTGTLLECTLTLETFTDATATDPIGTVTKTMRLTIPATSMFAPRVEVTFANVTSVPSGTVDVLLQNKSRVMATYTQQCYHNATLKSVVLSVAGGNNSVSGSSPLQTGILTSAGSNTINLTVTDSRGLQTTLQHKVMVYAYSNPTVKPASDESDIRAERCDEYGNWDGSGTFLRVKAKAGYSSLVVNGNDINSVSLRYRFRATGGTWNTWATFTGDTGAIADSYLFPQSTYQVEVGAVDAMGYEGSTIINIGTEEIYLHRTPNAMGIGMYVFGKTRTLAINGTWQVEIDGDILADFVVAKGTSGDWRYTKWKSGKVEAWYVMPSSTNVTAASQGATIKDIAVPSGIFSIAPNFILPTWRSDMEDKELGAVLVAPANSGHSTTNVRVIVRNASDISFPMRIDIYAVTLT